MEIPDEKNRVRRPERLFPIVRQLSYRLTPVLLSTRLHPNIITLASLGCGLLAAWMFSTGRWRDAVAGAAIFALAYILDHCDGEVARIRNLASKSGAILDDFCDWLVDGAFFIALGLGVSVARGEEIWVWFGIIAAVGGTIDSVIKIFFRKAEDIPDPLQAVVQGKASPRPETLTDWMIVIFHKFSRADFWLIVLILAVLDVLWVLLPLAAIGAQAYWIADLFKRTRRWHV